MVQQFVNKYFYYLFFFTYIFSIVLHDIIGFGGIDEICGFILLLLFFYNMFNYKEWPINKAFLLTLFLFLLYVGYSIWIGSNTKKAIATDLIIQMKPYLAFFCTYQLLPQLDKNQKNLLKETAMAIWVLLVPLGIAGFVNDNILWTVMGHPSCFAAAIVASSLIYLYCSDYTPRDRIIFLIMLALGIASGRSKFYGFFALAGFMILYASNTKHIKLNFKNVMAILLLLAVIVAVAYKKIELYFIEGIATEVNGNDGEQDFLARREHVERLMVVRERERHTQISVIEDNVLVEHYVSDIQEVATVGNIYLGRVQNVLPSMEAAFVDIGQARNGVLYAGEVNWDSARLEGQPRRIELAFKSGDPVLVQVTKDPIGHKGARLTSQVTLAGRFLVLVPSGGMTGVSRKLSERERARLKNIVSKIAPKDMGVIIRTAAEGASEEAITKDLENLVRQWERITAKRDEFLHGKRPKLLQGEPDVAIRVVRDIFNDDFSKMIVEGDRVYERIEEYLDTMAPDLKDKLEKWDPAEHDGKDVFDKWQIDSQLRKGMERQVYLPSGGSIVIDRTEAMTTIDVNTGRFIGRGKSLEETVTRCNLEAAEEIARQLRLRDIGGMVMIDFVDMVMPANRDLVLRRLVECLARDRTKHQVAEVTSLGLVQMTRKRIGQGLVEAFSEECPTCKGRGFILHDEPTVSADYDDPYALKGGDPFVKTNKHGHGTDVQVPKGSSPDVKAKLAQIAAAAVAANNADLGEEEQEE